MGWPPWSPVGPLGSLEERFLRGENCLEWLQDLQRTLRRDDENTRDIAIKVSLPLVK
jgi:hypothetical protein